ncbi:MAG: transcriptional regulator [Limimaricola sp.]|uniref:TfoX/Sxy family protein n=1 Tax=Limimaricola sp. TaxID=2211665 RepID=UPI001D9C410E|nr:TfoX/Sxy family protein [Limimaricola sp.]MBI1417678.1 transcriptional regulator [Limimaricola sp.]
MTVDVEFRSFVLDQLGSLGAFETRNMFGGTALLRNGVAFAKVKHGALWLKVDDSNIGDFVARDMPQYSYGKDNSRKLNFFRTPVEVLEDPEVLIRWATKACDAAERAQK